MRRVSIIVPCRNEKAHVEAFLASVLSQKLPVDTELEVLVADGLSSDGTKEVLQQYAARHQWIRVIENPERVASTALNRAIGRASGDIIIRMDVHAHYAQDYVEQCLAVMLETGADNVGGPAQTRAHGYRQEAISAAFNSSFSCGGARFHNVGYEGPVDTVTFGCWRKEIFNRVGLFDEELIRNQDDEFNLRLLRLGGQVFQSPRIRCWYEPRTSLRALFNQYFQFGYWKLRVIEKHGRPASLRHLIPPIFVASTIFLILGSLFSKLAFLFLIATMGAYATASLGASIQVCRGKRKRLIPFMPFVFATYHISYGCGFLLALLNRVIRSGRSRLHVIQAASGR
ncbi:MAG: glycosyl transferase, family 2 [Candidatus Acidoferrum typicum]|nr:glycosyl transferase, family 2 [Candidatus Acidoferrum typicum]